MFFYCNIIFLAEFICDEKTWIPLEKRCDGHNDCPAEFLEPGERTADEDLVECQPNGGWPSAVSSGL